MDDSIHSGLEDYLSGSASPEFLRALGKDSHFQQEVAQMKDLSGLMASLRSENAVPPPPYFYAKLANSIEESQRRRSAWNPFSFQSALGRRVAYASLLTLTFLGSYLVMRDDSSKQMVASPEAILASHDTSAEHNPADDRDRMMVALASYNGR